MNKGAKKTRAQLEKEAASLRKQLAALRRSVAGRNRAEEELRESEARMRAVLDSALDAVIGMDALGAIADWNPRAEAIFGWTRAEAIGCSLAERIIPPRYREAHTKGLHCYLTTGEGPVLNRRIEITALRRDGTEFPVELSISALKVGKATVFNAFIADITERKRAEQEIRHAQAFVASILENLPDMVFVKHANDLRFVRFNKAGEDLLGYSREELIGKNDHDFFPKVEADFFTAKDREVLAGGRLLDIPEEPIQTKARGLRILHTKKIPIYDDEGTPLYLLGISEDITERKHLEEQLRQAQKMEAVGTLAGGIAHDFNNILTPILSYTDLALHTLPADSPSRPDLEQVLVAARRAKNLVKQLLSFSRWDPGYRAPVSLGGLIKETLLFLRASIPTTIEIRPRLAALPDLVLADATQMQQALLNLCSNAEQAMRQTGGILELMLENCIVDAAFAAGHAPLQPGPHVRLTVRDSGCGMAPEILPRIYDPFFTTKGPGAGSGLGLSMVHGIVTSHKGAITVASAPGQGTTIAIYLPALERGAAGGEQPQKTVAKGEARILFVDDEAAVVRSGARLLRLLGYTVTAMDDSRQALDAFRAAPGQFDLVITDQTMPGMTGGALATALLRIRPDLPIILCTGFSHTMTAEQAAALGIRAFVTKPYTVEDMAAAIRRVLDQRTDGETTGSA